MRVTQAKQVTRKVAIVGSGPSGFYAAEALFKHLPDVQIDMYDRLPTPFGLVRGGVAPDHPKIKQVIEVYEKILRADRLEFIGNVQVGGDIALQELCAAYDVVLLAYGAGEGRPLGIPGEDLQGCNFANDFVGWYNGQPDYPDHVFDLSAETAVVIGHGNVATDVVRTLARPVDEWRRTDMSEHAIDALQESRVREIVVIGRRGPAQAKFTPGELKELSTIPGTSASVNPADLSLSAASGAEIDAPRNLECKKNMEIFQSLAHNLDAVPAPRHITFRFCESPVRINGEAQVESLTLVKNRLEGEPFCQTAVATGTRTELRCGLVFRSVGNRGVPIEGVGFDHRSGTIPHSKGRCIDGGRAVSGLYVTGWIKRGPTGLIGTNRADSVETVDSILEDLSARREEKKTGSTAIMPLLENKGIRTVDYQGWRVIDSAEREHGRHHGKPREKFTRIEEMIDALDAGDRHARGAGESE